MVLIANPPSSGTDVAIELDRLTENQVDVLAFVYHRPATPQREIGEYLGVSSASISNWVKDLPGFEWSDRSAYVEAIRRGTDPPGRARE